MAHSYTPGLRVTGDAVLRRERRLPLQGRVLVAKGAHVEPGEVVARTELPGNVQTVNLAARLGVDPPRAVDTLAVPVGTAVRKGETIARAKTLFGLMRQSIEAPADGTVESVSSVTGQLLLREPPIPVEVNAYVQGHVREVLPDEGVIVETRGALVQGIFGVGGETFGEVAIAVGSPDAELAASDLRDEHRGRVVVGGAHVTHAVVQRARELGVHALVVGGFDDHDLKRLLGRDLGVAITGQEDLGLTLVLTEGFGRIAMAERTWALLERHRGRIASVSGATQIRAGVQRPEIVVPLDADAVGVEEGEVGGGLEVGTVLRIIRRPYFGRIARVIELPAELQELESGAHVRVLVAEFVDDGSRARVPRANVERLAE